MPIGAKILVDALCACPGGSGINSSISLSRLGFKVGTVTKLGTDLNADSILHTLKKENVSFLGVKGKGNTGFSVVFSGLRGNRTLLSYKGNNDKLSSRDIVQSKLKTKWFYFGTMLNTSWKTQCTLARYAKKNGINILFNPSLYLAERGRKFLQPVLSACSLLILNKEEASAIAGSAGNVKTLLKKLQRNIPLVVITDGPHGAQAYNGMTFYSVHPKRVTVKEPTGAGDAFGSGYMAAIIKGKTLEEALTWGTVNSASVIGYTGGQRGLLKEAELPEWLARTKSSEMKVKEF